MATEAAPRPAWERKSKYHESIGTHNVCAVRVATLGEGNRRNVGWQFEAWRTSKRPHTWLGLYDSASEAREVCEKDAAGTPIVTPMTITNLKGVTA